MTDWIPITKEARESRAQPHPETRVETRAPAEAGFLNDARLRAPAKAILKRNAKPRPSLAAPIAAAWFLADMLEVSGYAATEVTKERHRSGYTTYRPMLTKPDPWYFAGLVALEACKICDLFEQDVADAVLREVLDQVDVLVGREDRQVSALVLAVMGRLGMGALLLHCKVPDILIAKVMRMLIGSTKNAFHIMPTRSAHAQVTSALKLGPPVWWKVFCRRYDVRLVPSAVRSVPLLALSPDAATAAA